MGNLTLTGIARMMTLLPLLLAPSVHAENIHDYSASLESGATATQASPEPALIQPSTWTVKGKRNSNIGFGDFRVGPYTVENISGFANSGETKWSIGGFGRNSQDHEDQVSFDLHQSGQSAASMRCSRALRDSGFNIGSEDGLEIGGIGGEKSSILNCQATQADSEIWTIQLAASKESPGFRGLLNNDTQRLELQPVPGSESTFTSGRSYRISRDGVGLAVIKRTVAGGSVTVESPITEAEQAAIGSAATLLLIQEE